MDGGVDIVEGSRATVQPAMLLPGVIGFYFSFRILIVPLAGLSLGDARAGVMLNLAINFLLLGVVAFHSWGPAPRTLGSILRLPCMGWVMLFVGFSGCSLAWTAAVSVAAAAAFWGAMAADLGIVVLLLRTGPIDEMASGLMKGYVYGACGVALVAWLLPAQSDLRLGVEDLLGPNQVGYAAAFAIWFAQYLMLRDPTASRWKLYAAFLAVTVLRSLSKTTILALIAGESVILLRDRTISRRTKVWVIVGSVLAVTAFWGVLSTYVDTYASSDSDVESLTGRVGIWTYMLDKAVEQPWIGHGFHSVWKVIPPFGRDQFEARHAHNEILQQFYTYGAAGVAMMIGLYGSFLRLAWRSAASPLRTLLLGLLVFVLVRGLADTEAFDLSLPMWGICLWSALLMEQQGAPRSHPVGANITEMGA